MVGSLGLVWVGTLSPRTNVVYRGRKQSVARQALNLRLKWRQQLALRAVALQVYAPKMGVLRLVVTKNRHGNYWYVVSNTKRQSPVNPRSVQHSVCVQAQPLAYVTPAPSPWTGCRQWRTTLSTLAWITSAGGWACWGRRRPAVKGPRRALKMKLKPGKTTRCRLGRGVARYARIASP